MLELEHEPCVQYFPCPSIFLPPLQFLPFPPENTKDNKHHRRKHSHFCKMVLKTKCSAIPRPAGSWPLGSLSITLFGDKERETSTVVRRGVRCTDASSTSLGLPLSRKQDVLEGGKYSRPYWLREKGDTLKSSIPVACETFSSSAGAVTELWAEFHTQCSNPIR